MRNDDTSTSDPESEDSSPPIWDRPDTDPRDDSDTDDSDAEPTTGGAGYETGSRSGGRHGAHKRSRGRGKPSKAPRTRGDVVRTGIRGLGQTLMTFGVIVLLFVVYEIFITDLFNDQRQDELTQELREDWGDDPTVGPDLPGGGLPSIPLGEGFAFIRIPAFGADYVKVIIEGTDPNELEQGPGHYVDSAMPGELGNFALAGHRVGKGSPFLDLNLLKPGDAVVIETVDAWFTYRVLGDPATGDYDTDPSGIPGQQIVEPEQREVVYPIPGETDSSVAPTSAYLTLTTCHPKFSAAQRLIVHAVLEGPGLSKVDYPDGPPAMAGN